MLNWQGQIQEFLEGWGGGSNLGLQAEGGGVVGQLWAQY